MGDVVSYLLSSTSIKQPIPCYIQHQSYIWWNTHTSVGHSSLKSHDKNTRKSAFHRTIAANFAGPDPQCPRGPSTAFLRLALTLPAPEPDKKCSLIFWEDFFFIKLDFSHSNDQKSFFHCRQIPHDGISILYLSISHQHQPPPRHFTLFMAVFSSGSEVGSGVSQASDTAGRGGELMASCEGMMLEDGWSPNHPIPNKKFHPESGFREPALRDSNGS